jgi:hypothetical protein
MFIDISVSPEKTHGVLVCCFARYSVGDAALSIDEGVGTSLPFR